MLDHYNEAIKAYGHGTLRLPDGGTMEIGGSTGGLSKHLLDGREEPDVDAFLKSL